MSKGVVMEKHRKFTIVMTGDGNFHKVKPLKEADIGAEVSYEFFASKKSGLLFFPSKKSSNLPVRYIAIACMVMLFVMPFYLLGGQSKAYAYVNLDINPSLEIELDKELNVVSISPLNSDARKLIQQLPNYEDKKIEHVIEIIMNKSNKLGLTKNGKNVLVGVSYVNEHDISVLDTIDNYFLTHNTSWKMATFRVPKEVRKLALKENISMNKVMADTMNDVASESENMIIQIPVNDEEKELIHSFYTNSKSNHQNTGEDETISVDQADVKHSTVVPHPEKKKNGEVHTKGKNQHKKSAKVEKKENPDKVKGKYKDKQEKKKVKQEVKQERQQAKERDKQERQEVKHEKKQEKHKNKDNHKKHDKKKGKQKD